MKRSKILRNPVKCHDTFLRVFKIFQTLQTTIKLKTPQNAETFPKDETLQVRQNVSGRRKIRNKTIPNKTKCLQVLQNNLEHCGTLAKKKAPQNISNHP